MVFVDRKSNNSQTLSFPGLLN